MPLQPHPLKKFTRAGVFKLSAPWDRVRRKETIVFSKKILKMQNIPNASTEETQLLLCNISVLIC